MLKEAWLFGKLQTVGTSVAEKRAEDASAKAFEGIARLGAAGAFDIGGGMNTDSEAKGEKGQGDIKEERGAS